MKSILSLFIMAKLAQSASPGETINSIRSNSQP